jgi:hypothetical protein
VIRANATPIYKVAGDLSQIGFRTVPALRGSMAAVGEAFAEEWRRNARETSGMHGKWYPDSIDSELAFSITNVTVEAGPNTAKRQGKMGPGFEFGSENQPPHLDGLRALDGMQPRVEAIIDATMGFVFK